MEKTEVIFINTLNEEHLFFLKNALLDYKVREFKKLKKFFNFTSKLNLNKFSIAIPELREFVRNYENLLPKSEIEYVWEQYIDPQPQPQIKKSILRVHSDDDD